MFFCFIFLTVACTVSATFNSEDLDDVCDPTICVGGVYIDSLVPFWTTDYSYHPDIFGMFTLASPEGFNNSKGMCVQQ